MTSPRVVPLVLLLAACNRTPIAPMPSATQSVVADEITLDGEPPPDDFADVVREHTDALLERAERCYADRLAARPGVGGEHRLRVYVSAAQIIRVTTESSTLDDPPLEDCVKQRILQYELPPEAPRGGIMVRFRLRFTPPA